MYLLNTGFRLLRILLVLFSLFSNPMVYLGDRFFCTHIIPHHRKSCLFSQQKSWAIESASNNWIQMTTFSVLGTWLMTCNLKALKPKLQPLGHSWKWPFQSGMFWYHERQICRMYWVTAIAILSYALYFIVHHETIKMTLNFGFQCLNHTFYSSFGS